jgi:hypothetical protein
LFQHVAVAEFFAAIHHWTIVQIPRGAAINEQLICGGKPNISLRGNGS